MSAEELRDKVIKGLECCIPMMTKHGYGNCQNCPYDREITMEKSLCDCCYDLLSDALGLLKAQEPRVLTKAEFEASCAGAGWIEIWLAPSDGDPEDYVLEQAAWAGKSVAMDDGYGKKDELTWQYGEKYGIRVWTEWPTPEQRKATPWETC